MPLAFVAYLALCAGLALGESAPLLAVLIGAGTATLAALRRDARFAGLALTFGAGSLTIVVSNGARERCRTDAVTAAALDVVLLSDARPGAVAVAVGERCAISVQIVVAHGRGEVGDVVHVRGVSALTARGALVRAATITQLGASRTIPRWRARVGAMIDSLFDDDAPLARALVVADVSRLPRDLRDRFADAGLVHILSVSGLHVSLIAAALELLLVAARLPRRTAGVAAAVCVAGYVLAIGAPAPAIRAGTMLGAQIAARLLQRPTSPWATLALGGTLPLLLDPAMIFDVGYQLSMGGMASLVAGRALVRRQARDDVTGWRRVAMRELIVSIVASLVTAPVVAWWFGRLSIVGPLANLLAAPIVSLLQPTLFLVVLLAPARSVALHIAGAARLLMHALDAVATVAADVPHASVSVAPSAVTLVLSVIATTALLTACAARRAWIRERSRLVTACAVAAAVVVPLAPPAASGRLELHMLDVGQGDAIALRTPKGRWILMDAGRVWAGGDAGRTTVLPYLRRHGGPLAAFLLSHPHADHVGGAATVLQALRPPLYLDPGFALGSETYRASLDAARRAGISWRRVHPGDSLVVDGVVLRVLAPDSAWTSRLDDPNLASMMVSVRYGGVRFLLVGDAEAPEEQWVVDRAAADPAVADALRADVLKVAHHGSRTSSTPEFLALVRPRLALVSVGAGNSYRLPNVEVLQRIADDGAEVLRTDQWGPIVATTDGRRIVVDAGGVSWTVPARATPMAESAGSSRVSRAP